MRWKFKFFLIRISRLILLYSPSIFFRHRCHVFFCYWVSSWYCCLCSSLSSCCCCFCCCFWRSEFCCGHWFLSCSWFRCGSWFWFITWFYEKFKMISAFSMLMMNYDLNCWYLNYTSLFTSHKLSYITDNVYDLLLCSTSNTPYLI